MDDFANDFSDFTIGKDGSDVRERDDAEEHSGGIGDEQSTDTLSTKLLFDLFEGRGRGDGDCDLRHDVGDGP